MKVTVNTRALSKVLMHMKRLIGNGSGYQVPCFSWITLQASDDMFSDYLRVRLCLPRYELTCDIDTVEGELCEQGEVCVDCMAFAKMLTKAKANETVAIFDVGKGALDVWRKDTITIQRSIGSKQGLLLENKEDRVPRKKEWRNPEKPEDKVGTITLPTLVWQKAFARTAFVISDEPTRENLNYLLLEVKQGKLSFVATDGKRLGVYSMDVPASMPDGKWRLHRKAIQTLLGILPKRKPIREEASLVIMGDLLVFVYHTMTLVTQESGEILFPSWRDVIVNPKDNLLTVAREDLLTAVQGAAAASKANSKWKEPRMELHLNKQVLSVMDWERREDKDSWAPNYLSTLAIQEEGTEGVVHYYMNPAYLVDAIKEMQTEFVSLAFDNPTSVKIKMPHDKELAEKLMPQPMLVQQVVEDKPDNTWQQVIMPVKI